MKFLVLALCVCAASAASFNSGFYSSEPVASRTGPFQYAKASATSGAPNSYVVKPVVPVPVVYGARSEAPAVTPVVYAAKAVAQTVATPAEYAKTVAQAPSATPVEYAAAKAVVQTAATPFEYAKTVATPVVAAKNYYKDAEASIVRLETDVQPDAFKYIFETNNGIGAKAAGDLKKVGDVDVLAFRGGYRYTAPDGTPVEITYIADENGYQPQSNLLPVAPPVPEPIARSLAYIASHTPVYAEKKY